MRLRVFRDEQEQPPNPHLKEKGMTEVWQKHEAGPLGRRIASDLPIEARLRGEGFFRNYAGNFDNWKWRETGPGTVEAYRVLSRDEAQALRRAMLAAAPPAEGPVSGVIGNRPNYPALREFLDGPCPICRGVHGCSHTVAERLDAGRSVLRFGGSAVSQ